MVCDEEVARLARTVANGDLMALAPLLDRLYELGDKRGEHLHSAVGWMMEKVFNTSIMTQGPDRTTRMVQARGELTSWVARAFWPEMHGGAVKALEWAVSELER